MPVVFRYRGFRSFFYSNEGNPREPVHIHVRTGSATAKCWVLPDVEVAESWGFDAPTLKELLPVVEGHRELIVKAWHEHFG